MNARLHPKRHGNAYKYELTDDGRRALDSLREEDTTTPERPRGRAGWTLTPAAQELLDGTNR